MSQVICQVWREVVGCHNWPVMRVPLFIALRRNDGKLTFVQVKSWCHQAASYYLSHILPRSLSAYGITMPQWVNTKCPTGFHDMSSPIFNNGIWPKRIKLKCSLIMDIMKVTVLVKYQVKLVVGTPGSIHFGVWCVSFLCIFKSLSRWQLQYWCTDGYKRMFKLWDA